MDKDTLIAIVSHMTDETDDSTLSAYIDFAKAAIMNKVYPYGDIPKKFPHRYDQTAIEIAVYMLNKRGAEEQTSHAENGITRHFESGSIPDSLLNNLTPYVSVIKPPEEEDEDTEA